jgi:hypothetical protein
MTKVFYRTMRPYKNGYGEVTKYIEDPKYAQQPKAYIRGLETIQKDLLNIFDFIEPTEKNLKCYSFRIHELFLRSCIEIEANFKAILTENNYKTDLDKLNINDYKKLAKTHNLPNYKVKIPYSHDKWSIRTPFANWPDGKLNWYRDYNSVKHSRVDQFKKSNLENLLDAVCGLLIILSAQFFLYRKFY